MQINALSSEIDSKREKIDELEEIVREMNEKRHLATIKEESDPNSDLELSDIMDHNLSIASPSDS
jgi:hypothetical protein